jgi:hypothetical protein
MRPARIITAVSHPHRRLATALLRASLALAAGLALLLGALPQPAAATTIAPTLVPLGTHRFGHLRAPEAIVAHADAAEVGFEQPPEGADGVANAPWEFDVAKDGSIWLLDQVNHRLLIWQPGRPNHPARTLPLPMDPLERIADFAVAGDGTIYATYVPPPGPGPKTLRLCALSPSGQLRWTAATINEIFNAPLRIGPDGALWAFDGLPGQVWTPLTTPAGRPLPLAEQRRRTSPQQPLPGGQRLTITYVSAHERHVTLNDHAGQPLRSWRITSQTDLGALRSETPTLVGGDPVVVVEVTKQTTAKFLYEFQILRLARAGGTSVRFAIDPASRAQWGDPPFTGVRVGPDGQLYQLRTSPTSGVDIARYSLTPAKATPPTPAPAPTPPIDHGGQPAPAVTTPPVITVPPAQPATPPANPVAAHPATNRWLLPGLAALGASLLAGLSSWLLYRRRHPASPDLHGQSQVAR